MNYEKLHKEFVSFLTEEGALFLMIDVLRNEFGSTLKDHLDLSDLTAKQHGLGNGDLYLFYSETCDFRKHDIKWLKRMPQL